MNRAKNLIVVLLLAVTAAWAVPEVDQPAPALKGRFFSGRPFDLREMRGKVVLVNFYSSYCKYCAYEIGNLETFYESHRDRGFEVIVVGVDPLEDRHRVERMVGLYGLQGVMADDLSESGFERRYPTPTAFVIDRNGMLRSRTWGSKTPRFFSENVLPLLRAQ
ncbi:MAG TPA: TlpA disulfide reductase family protein [Burkholderiales bacterium]|jgi:peroxiredoxin|nr:TlpA disulfide reductase family protein [Burkholderiales bacterium]